MQDNSGLLARLLAAAVSPDGRMGRVAYLIWSILLAVVFVGVVLIWNHIPHDTLYWQSYLIMVPFIAFWPKFTTAAKRVHDFNVPSLAALIYLLLPAWAFATRFVLPLFTDFYSDMLDANIPANIALGLLGLSLVADLGLFIIPGNRQANRFGPPPGKTRQIDTGVF